MNNSTTEQTAQRLLPIDYTKDYCRKLIPFLVPFAASGMLAVAQPAQAKITFDAVNTSDKLIAQANFQDNSNELQDGKKFLATYSNILNQYGRSNGISKDNPWYSYLASSATNDSNYIDNLVTASPIDMLMNYQRTVSYHAGFLQYVQDSDKSETTQSTKIISKSDELIFARARELAARSNNPNLVNTTNELIETLSVRSKILKFHLNSSYPTTNTLRDITREGTPTYNATHNLKLNGTRSWHKAMINLVVLETQSASQAKNLDHIIGQSERLGRLANLLNSGLKDNEDSILTSLGQLTITQSSLFSSVTGDPNPATSNTETNLSTNDLIFGYGGNSYLTRQEKKTLIKEFRSKLQSILPKLNQLIQEAQDDPTKTPTLGYLLANFFAQTGLGLPEGAIAEGTSIRTGANTRTTPREISPPETIAREERPNRRNSKNELPCRSSLTTETLALLKQRLNLPKPVIIAGELDRIQGKLFEEPYLEARNCLSNTQLEEFKEYKNSYEGAGRVSIDRTILKWGEQNGVFTRRTNSIFQSKVNIEGTPIKQGYYYELDRFHIGKIAEIEVYNKQGLHIGTMDLSGKSWINTNGKPGRIINIK